MIDFQQLKRDVPIEKAVSLLGLTTKPEGNQLRAPCPVCKSGGDRAIVITPEKQIFYCFAKQKGGDVISLAAHIRECSVKEAATFLAGNPPTVPEKKNGEGASSPDPTPPKKGKKVFDPSDYLAKLDYTHALVTQAGLTEQEAKDLGVGVPAKGAHAGKLVIALRKADGTIAVFGSATGLTLPKKWGSRE